MLPHVKAYVKFSLLSAILLASLAGCFNRALDFQIRFDDVHGLKKGDPVYFEETVIGTVTAVDYTDSGNFLVSVAIQNEFANAATVASRFYIDGDPEKRSQKLLRVVQLAKGGDRIEAGEIVDGHTKYAVLYDQFAYQLGQNITLFESGINEFLEALKGFSNDEQIKELEKQLDDIIADLGHMSREMKDKLENEILPLLREKIEELRKSLEGTGQEKDLESIDRKMETATDALKV